MTRWLLVSVLAACRFTPGESAARDDDADVEDIDAAEMPPDDATVEPDVPVASTCMQRWHAGTIRFGAPTRITAASSSAADRDPFVSADELSLYFYSERTDASGGADIYVVKRANTSAAFSSVGEFSEVNSTSGETKMAMTTDGLYIIVSTSRPGGSGDYDLWNSRRINTSMPFPALDRVHMENVNTSTAQLDGHVTGDGLDLYFAHSPTSTSVQKIAHASRITRAVSFGQFALVTELDSNTGDADPTVSNDKRLIVYSSNRTGSGVGGSNMWYATRAGTTGPFGTPAVIPDVNSNASDGDPVLSADGCRLYFASDRETNIGYEIYVAEALP